MNISNKITGKRVREELDYETSNKILKIYPQEFKEYIKDILKKIPNVSIITPNGTIQSDLIIFDSMSNNNIIVYNNEIDSDEFITNLIDSYLNKLEEIIINDKNNSNNISNIYDIGELLFYNYLNIITESFCKVDFSSYNLDFNIHEKIIITDVEKQIRENMYDDISTHNQLVKELLSQFKENIISIDNDTLFFNSEISLTDNLTNFYDSNIFNLTSKNFNKKYFEIKPLNSLFDRIYENIRNKILFNISKLNMLKSNIIFNIINKYFNKYMDTIVKTKTTMKTIIINMITEIINYFIYINYDQYIKKYFIKYLENKYNIIESELLFIYEYEYEFIKTYPIYTTEIKSYEKNIETINTELSNDIMLKLLKNVVYNKHKYYNNIVVVLLSIFNDHYVKELKENLDNIYNDINIDKEINIFYYIHYLKNMILQIQTLLIDFNPTKLLKLPDPPKLDPKQSPPSPPLILSLEDQILIPSPTALPLPPLILPEALPLQPPVKPLQPPAKPTSPKRRVPQNLLPIQSPSELRITPQNSVIKLKINLPNITIPVYLYDFEMSENLKNILINNISIIFEKYLIFDQENEYCNEIKKDKNFINIKNKITEINSNMDKILRIKNFNTTFKNINYIIFDKNNILLNNFIYFIRNPIRKILNEIFTSYHDSNIDNISKIKEDMQKIINTTYNKNPFEINNYIIKNILINKIPMYTKNFRVTNKRSFITKYKSELDSIQKFVNYIFIDNPDPDLKTIIYNLNITQTGVYINFKNQNRENLHHISLHSHDEDMDNINKIHLKNDLFEIRTTLYIYDISDNHNIYYGYCHTDTKNNKKNKISKNQQIIINVIRFLFANLIMKMIEQKDIIPDYIYNQQKYIALDDPNLKIMYYNKYLKYKQKYLELKDEMQKINLI